MCDLRKSNAQDVVTTTSCDEPMKPLTLEDLKKAYELLKPEYDTVIMNQKTHDLWVNTEPEIFKNYKVGILNCVGDGVIYKINTEKLLESLNKPLKPEFDFTKGRYLW